MDKIIFTLFILIFSVKLSFANTPNESVIRDVLERSVLIKKNTKIFSDNGYWKEKTREVFWNQVLVTYLDGQKYCLLFRRLKNYESLMLTKTTLSASCVESTDHYIWQAMKIDQTQIKISKEHINISYKRDANFKNSIQLEFYFLSNQSSLKNVRLMSNGGWKKSELMDTPCKELDKQCNVMGDSYCELCPQGVIGSFDEKSCGSQKLFCRSEVCGNSEQQACQRLLEKSNVCQENLSKYFCQANLNKKCTKEMIKCF